MRRQWVINPDKLKTSHAVGLGLGFDHETICIGNGIRWKRRHTYLRSRDVVSRDIDVDAVNKAIRDVVHYQGEQFIGRRSPRHFRHLPCIPRKICR